MLAVSAHSALHHIPANDRRLVSDGQAAETVSRGVFVRDHGFPAYWDPVEQDSFWWSARRKLSVHDSHQKFGSISCRQPVEMADKIDKLAGAHGGGVGPPCNRTE